MNRTPSHSIFSHAPYTCVHTTLWLKVLQRASHKKHVHPHVIMCLIMDRLPSLDFWDIVIQTLRSPHAIKKPCFIASGDQSTIEASGDRSTIPDNGKHPGRSNKVKSEIGQSKQVDYVPSNTHSSQGDSKLYIFEDNEAVVKMMIKGRSPTMRHVSRTHRVALDWLFDRINLCSLGSILMC